MKKIILTIITAALGFCSMAQSGRYAKITINNGTSLDIKEIEWMSGTTSYPSPKKTNSTGTQNSQNNAAAWIIYDGITTASYWAGTFTTPISFTIDFNSIVSIDAVKINLQNWSTLRGFDCQLSNDNVNWTSVYTTNATQVGGNLSYSFPDLQAPSAPSSLASSAITLNSFTLNWNASTDNVGVSAYEVFLNGISLGTTSSTNFSFSGLQNGTSYTSSVRARDATGNWSSISNLSVSTLSDTEAPSTPTNLLAGQISQTSFSLSWNASTDNVAVERYQLFSNGNPVATVQGTTFALTGLTASTSYSVSVIAIDAAGNSSSSALVTVTTLAIPDNTPPSVPSSLVASIITETSFTLSWTASTDNSGVALYEVYRNGVAIATTTSTNLNVTSLQPNTLYYMSVRARDTSDNWSALSTTLGVNTLQNPASLCNVSIQNSGFSSGTSSWSNWGGFSVSGGEGIAGPAQGGFAQVIANMTAGRTYTLTAKARLSNNPSYATIGMHFRNSTGTTLLDVKTVVTGTTTSSFTVSSIAPTNTTSIQVYVWKSGTVGEIIVDDFCLNETGGTPDNQAPSVPSGLSATSISQTSFILNWTASTDNVAVTGYEVFRNNTSVGTTTSTSLNVNGLSSSTSYSMTVRARDAAGNWSAQSSAINVTTSSPVVDTQAPSVPTNLSATSISQTSFVLSWTTSTDNIGVTGYEVFRNGTSLGTTSSISFNVNGLVASTSYSMAVRARDAAGNWSAQSSSINVTTSGAGSGNDNVGALQGNKMRVFICTDISEKAINNTGGDIDDHMSLVSILLFADVLDIEGISGERASINRVLDKYELDYPTLATWGNYPTPAYLRSIVFDGYSANGQLGLQTALRKNDPRPLYTVVWGGAGDVKNALLGSSWWSNPAGDITLKSKLRLITIANQDGASHSALEATGGIWWIKVFGSLYAALYGPSTGSYNHLTFLNEKIAGKGNLGTLYAYFNSICSYCGGVREGDSPSWWYLLSGDPNNADSPHWGGRYRLGGTNVWYDSGEGGSANNPVCPEPCYGQNSIYKFKSNLFDEYAARFNRAAAPKPARYGVSDEFVLTQEVMLFPNPATNAVEVNLLESSTGSLHIFNIQGKVIKEINFENLSSVHIDLNSFTSGMYLVSLKTSKISKMLKLEVK